MTETSIQCEESAEPTLAEELATLGEEDLIEMVNLREQDTGIPGVLFISTAPGPHGPRVKYFVEAGRDQPSFSVSIAPEASGPDEQPAGARNPARRARSGRLGQAESRSAAALLE